MNINYLYKRKLKHKETNNMVAVQNKKVKVALTPQGIAVAERAKDIEETR